MYFVVTEDILQMLQYDGFIGELNNEDREYILDRIDCEIVRALRDGPNST